MTVSCGRISWSSVAYATTQAEAALWSGLKPALASVVRMAVAVGVEDRGVQCGGRGAVLGERGVDAGASVVVEEPADVAPGGVRGDGGERVRRAQVAQADPGLAAVRRGDAHPTRAGVVAPRHVYCGALRDAVIGRGHRASLRQSSRTTMSSPAFPPPEQPEVTSAGTSRTASSRVLNIRPVRRIRRAERGDAGDGTRPPMRNGLCLVPTGHARDARTAASGGLPPDVDALAQRGAPEGAHLL